MLSDLSISVQGISKCFKIYENPTDRLKHFFKEDKKYYKEYWALKDITIDIPKGKIVGIIGKNGSGKSTLLQIIAGTMSPTEGTVKVKGNVAALLELGSGFNPEFTGRENIYMNAAILGITKEEIEDHIDDIIDFADIGDFIDRQVKTYSSGMFVRLAFSVSTFMIPEVLIVDEALSVGDVAFQKKCFDRIKQLIAKGTTVILVSHDMSTIRMLCDTVVYLEDGQIKMIGDPKVVVDEFMKKMLGKDDHLAEDIEISHANQDDELNKLVPNHLKFNFHENIDKTINGSYKAILYECYILDEIGKPITSLKSKKSYTIRCKIKVNEYINYFNIGILIRDKFGQDIFGKSVNNLEFQGVDSEFDAGDELICDIHVDLNIKHGTYFLTIGLQDIEFNEIYFYGNDIIIFDLEADKDSVFGLVDIPCDFRILEKQVQK